MDSANILKIESLPDDWRDKDSIILHACFQLLKDFVEKEDVAHRKNNWEADESRVAAKAEIDELYTWWLSYGDEGGTIDKEKYELENAMLTRLINVRWALWT